MTPVAASENPATAEKLPVWRLIAGLAVLVAMAAVLVRLTPIYVENFKLQRSLRGMAREPGFSATFDDAVRERVLARARELNLPVNPDNIEITRTNGGLKVQMAYAVDMNLALYRVDLHFHAGATAGPATESP